MSIYGITAPNRGKLLGEGLWDDLRFPSSGINPPGAASDPARNNVTGLLDFSGTQDNIIAGLFEMPHMWLQGSELAPHLHLRMPTADAGKVSRWKFEYDRSNPTGDWESDYQSYANSETISVVNPGNVRRSVMAGFSRIDMTGYVESCQVAWRLTRLANSDPLDNDTSVIALAFWDIHWQVEKLGTFNEYHR